MNLDEKTNPQSITERSIENTKRTRFKRIKKWLKVVAVFLLLFHLNIGYWTLSNIQDECYDKVYRKHQSLNLYEKSSIYSIHVAMCLYGWVLSPEAWRQQVYCTFPTNDIQIWHSDHLSNDKKIKSLIAKGKSNVFITYVPKSNGLGRKTPYLFGELRSAVAINGTYLIKEDDKWIITPKDNEFIYPYIKDTTYIGPFKFNESLLRHLQLIGWLYISKYKWVVA